MKIYKKINSKTKALNKIKEIMPIHGIRRKHYLCADLNIKHNHGAFFQHLDDLCASSFKLVGRLDKKLAIEAKPKQLMKVLSKNNFDLLRAAYYLGHRNVPLMFTPTALYFEPDYVLAEKLMGLGLMINEEEQIFEQDVDIPFG